MRQSVAQRLGRRAIGCGSAGGRADLTWLTLSTSEISPLLRLANFGGFLNIRRRIITADAHRRTEIIRRHPPEDADPPFIDVGC